METKQEKKEIKKIDKINRETAVLEFERFADTMCLDIDEMRMAPEDVKSFEAEKNKIVDAICRGDLIISDKGEPVFTPRISENVDPITFYAPTGECMIAADRRSKGQEFAKYFETMGQMTHTHAARFRKMATPDLLVCYAITSLFLA